MSKSIGYAALAALLLAGAAGAADAAVRVQVGNYAPLSADAAQTAVTLRINDAAIANGLRYGQSLAPISLAPAPSYRFQLFLPGGTTPVVDQIIALADASYTVVVLGNNVTQAFGFAVALDSATAPPSGSGWLRFIHAAGTGAPIAIRQLGTPVNGAESIPYGQQSPYIAGTAGNYDFTVTSTSGATTYADPPGFVLAAGTTANFVFAGDGVRQPYQLFALSGAGTGPIATVDYSANGAWTTGPATGQGIFFNPIPTERRLIGSWYTYGTGGALTWYTLDSCRTPAGTTGCTNPNGFDNRTATLAVYAPSGGTFLGTNPISLRNAGTLTVTFQSCTQATATYDVDGRTGSFAMSNFVPISPCTITSTGTGEAD